MRKIARLLHLSVILSEAKEPEHQGDTGRRRRRAASVRIRCIASVSCAE
jgi:hypothetical protein